MGGQKGSVELTDHRCGPPPLHTGWCACSKVIGKTPPPPASGPPKPPGDGWPGLDRGRLQDARGTGRGGAGSHRITAWTSHCNSVKRAPLCPRTRCCWFPRRREINGFFFFFFFFSPRGSICIFARYLPLCAAFILSRLFYLRLSTSAFVLR